MSLEEKLALLKKYNSLDYYKKDQYVDAQDTTDVFCLAKIYEVS